MKQTENHWCSDRVNKLQIHFCSHLAAE